MTLEKGSREEEEQKKKWEKKTSPRLGLNSRYELGTSRFEIDALTASPRLAGSASKSYLLAFVSHCCYVAMQKCRIGTAERAIRDHNARELTNQIALRLLVIQ